MWHPAVSEAAVVAMQNPESGVRIIAYLVVSEASPASIIELKSFCKVNLPAYMNPDAFIFVKHLPRTSANKVDYRDLTQRIQMAEQVSGPTSA
jgi:acyl-coenzyme A synthetase/AMP-(fatty) acid ligase